ncbi:hypothetical protein BDR07DRAFT_859290 [Suillus spraguei]|nr:hypothetical protein BDR07DRAFT_859290 [Suillus spraguei]
MLVPVTARAIAMGVPAPAIAMAVPAPAIAMAVMNTLYKAQPNDLKMPAHVPWHNFLEGLKLCAGRTLAFFGIRQTNSSTLHINTRQGDARCLHYFAIDQSIRVARSVVAG